MIFKEEKSQQNEKIQRLMFSITEFNENYSGI